MAAKKQIGSADFFIEKKTSKGSSNILHQHQSFELYYLINGKREYFIGDRHFPISAGSIVLIPPKVLHTTTSAGGLRYLLHFSESFLRQYFTDEMLKPLFNQLPFVFCGDDIENDHIKRILATMLAEFNNAASKQIPQNDVLLAGYLYQLLFIAANESNSYVFSSNADKRITQIIQYINKNYGYINDIEEIAQAFFISKSHLCRLFKKSLGITLVSYLNTIKIKAACALIKEDEEGLNQIALHCGFNSYSYFCKVFKFEKGVTPTEYRKRHKYL